HSARPNLLRPRVGVGGVRHVEYPPIERFELVAGDSKLDDPRFPAVLLSDVQRPLLRLREVASRVEAGPAGRIKIEVSTTRVDVDSPTNCALSCVIGAVIQNDAVLEPQRIGKSSRIRHISPGIQSTVETGRIGCQVFAGVGVVPAMAIVVQAGICVGPLPGKSPWAELRLTLDGNTPPIAVRSRGP